MSFIPLQTTDESIIGKISKIHYRGNKFYILDSQQKVIFIFDEQGNFLSKIDNKGKGPCEYIDIWDFYVDNTGFIQILSQTFPAKIIVYAPDLSCKEIIVKGWAGDNFSPLGKGYIIYSPNGANQSEKRYYLFYADKEGNVLDKWLPSHNYAGYSIDHRPFSSFGDTLLFHKPFDNHLYQITPQGNISVRYVLDFGKYQIPESEVALFQTNMQYYIENSDGYITKLDYWYENLQFIMLSYLTENSGSSYFGLYFKQKDELLILEISEDIAIALSSPVAMLEDDNFLTCLEIPEYWFDQNEMYVEYKKSLLDKYPGLDRVMTSLKEGSNPVLIRYKFKIH